MSQIRVEQVIAGFAARQHGVVARAQLLAGGLSSHHVEHRLSTGQLVRVHQGVYRVGPVAAPRFREMAAVLACGDGAAVSHESAARLWGLMPVSRAGEPIDIALRRGHRRRPSVQVHRLPTLLPGDVARVEGIPVTTAGRTLWDLAGRISGRDLERALAEALDRRLTRSTELQRLLARHQGAPGSGRLRALLETDAALTRSEPEERFLGLVKKAGLPEPRTNVRVAGVEVDCFWPDAGVVVEIDGFAYHGSQTAFEADRRRDGRLTSGGLAVIRVTWRQLTGEPLAVIARVAQALARPARL